MNEVVKTDPKTGAWELDVAAFIPEPAGHVAVEGIRYPVFSFLDLTVEDSLRVAKIGDDLEKISDDYAARMERSIEQIVMLNRGPEQGREGRPFLTAEMLRKLSAKQIVWITALAMSVARVPRVAGEEGQSDSASSAPAPAGSTASTPASS